jgi:hypothetical protein
MNLNIDAPETPEEAFYRKLDRGRRARKVIQESAK